MKSINTLFLNLVQRIKNALASAKAYSDANLQIAKDYSESFTNSACNDLVRVIGFTSASRTFNANSGTQVIVDVTTPSGYKPISPVYARTNGNVLSIYASGLSNNNTKADAWVKNFSTSQSFNASVTIFILFIKDFAGGVIANLFATLSPKGVTA